MKYAELDKTMESWRGLSYYTAAMRSAAVNLPGAELGSINSILRVSTAGDDHLVNACSPNRSEWRASMASAACRPQWASIPNFHSQTTLGGMISERLPIFRRPSLTSQ